MYRGRLQLKVVFRLQGFNATQTTEEVPGTANKQSKRSSLIHVRRAKCSCFSQILVCMMWNMSPDHLCMAPAIQTLLNLVI